MRFDLINFCFGYPQISDVSFEYHLGNDFEQKPGSGILLDDSRGCPGSNFLGIG